MIDLNERGHVRQRECQTLEFKETFRLGDALIEYARTLVGMANNQGGSLVFGVANNPRNPIGLRDDRFASFDTKDLNRVLLGYFSSDIDWNMETFDVAGATFGRIQVQQAPFRPIVCTRSHAQKNLREGAVYFRYRGETREIRAAELVAMLANERDRERQLWIKHIQSIATVGPQAAHILDLSRKRIDFGSSKVLIDESLVGKLKLVKEGHFTEREGAPALRLIGDIDGVLGPDHIVVNEATYPYTESTLLEHLSIGQHSLRALIWHLEIKGDSEYHMEIRTGRTGVVHKYSNRLLARVREIVRSEPSVLTEAIAAYRARGR
ncbi:AlbA family DNA-binding domain-containing protein [Luteimonas abyssi]|uniref:AlbA family DNA-binding domain-containing protein n=1 Tax=Luteimonas abyssi TaxID=1247514 RepID=UPI0009E878E4|nr:ATP-binding protein [Luteimonas abyssi]